MNCPTCNGKLRRTRTIDHGNSVERYNRCLSCGRRTKTVEMFTGDYKHERMENIGFKVESERTIRQLSLKLDTIAQAFGTIHDIVQPLREAEQAESDDVRESPGSWHRMYLK